MHRIGTGGAAGTFGWAAASKLASVGEQAMGQLAAEAVETGESQLLAELAARLTGVLLQLGVKRLCRRPWAHQPVTRGPERPIVAHRRNGWKAVTRPSSPSDVGVPEVDLAMSAPSRPQTPSWRQLIEQGLGCSQVERGPG
jgi:hypothetical protein